MNPNPDTTQGATFKRTPANTNTPWPKPVKPVTNGNYPKRLPMTPDECKEFDAGVRRAQRNIERGTP